MIIFIGPNRQRSNVKRLGEHPKAPPYKYRTYTWLYRTFRLPAATYIFTGIDRLDFNERRLAGKIYRHINAAGAGFRALNDPAHAKGRYALLRGLHDAGINRFNAYLGSNNPKPTNFPVFVRRNSLSTQPLTELLQTQTELDDALQTLAAHGEPLDDLVIIEYCAEPIQAGIFRKYSSYYLAGKTVLSWSIFEKNWMVKNGEIDIVDENVYAQEWPTVEQNSFSDVIGNVFKVANIEYGRADFGLVDGRPQIYEINFNPHFRTMSSSSKSPTRQKTVALVLDRHVSNLADLSLKTSRAINNIADPDITAHRWRFWRNYAPQRY
ncbi:hypothetical protein [Maritalea sp.]|jgi:hypothetical protein|uniref:hypothetical protein n=1 Tax=Maritalea sp. TaxID=2003361 RepID=UPI0039E50F5E